MSDLAEIRVSGLKELQKSLKAIDAGKELRPALNEVAQVVVNIARPRIPQRSGLARASLRAASTATAARVQAGGSRAPYYPWLDYGGKTGRGKSIARPFERHGRYIYPAYWSQQANIQKMLETRIAKVIEANGLEVT